MTAENLRIGNVVVVEPERGSFKVHVVGADPIINDGFVTFKPILKKNRTGEFFVSTQNVRINLDDNEIDAFDVISTIAEFEATDYSDELNSTELSSVRDLFDKAEPKMRWAFDNLVTDVAEPEESADAPAEDESDSMDAVSSAPEASSVSTPALVTTRYYVSVTHFTDMDPRDGISRVLESMPHSIQTLTE